MTVKNRRPATPMRPAAAPAIAIALAMAGCQGTPQGAVEVQKATLESPDAIAACLPAGVTLDAKTTDKEGDSSETVGDALARLKATSRNKKIYDLNGREIVFYKPTVKGLAIVKDKEYNRLRKTGTVVLLAP